MSGLKRNFRFKKKANVVIGPSQNRDNELIEIKLSDLNSLVADGIISLDQKREILNIKQNSIMKNSSLSKSTAQSGNANTLKVLLLITIRMIKSNTNINNSNKIINKSNLLYIQNHKNELDENTLTRLYSSIQEVLKYDPKSLMSVETLKSCLFEGLNNNSYSDGIDNDAFFECISTWICLIEHLPIEASIFYPKLWKSISGHLELSSLEKLAELFIEELNPDQFYSYFKEAIKKKSCINHITILQYYIYKNRNKQENEWIECLNSLRTSFLDISLFHKISLEITRNVTNDHLMELLSKYIPDDSLILYNFIIESSQLKKPESNSFTGAILIPDGSVLDKFDHILKESQRSYDLMENILIKEDVIEKKKT